jgi:hypothetical protein
VAIVRGWHPNWFALAAVELQAKDNMFRVGQVNCMEELFLCKSFKVKAYPVIMVIHKRTQYYFEKGERSADTLMRFAKNIAMGGNTADISSLYQSQC